MSARECPNCLKAFFGDQVREKLLVSTRCGHSMCDACVNRLFQSAAQLACGECGCSLKKTDYRVPLFEDGMTDLDVYVRKRILDIYNKEEKDFETLREWNDYLERVEDIIYGITENLDRAALEREVAEYERKNRIHIMRKRRERDQNRKRREMMEREEERRAQEEAEAEAEAQRDLAIQMELEADARGEGDAGAGQGRASQGAMSMGASVGSVYMPTSMGAIEWRVPKPVDKTLIVGSKFGQLERITRELRTTLTKEEKGAAKAGGYSVEVTEKRFVNAALGGLFVW